MIIDEKGKLFGKISIIDIIIVLVVIVAIGGVGYKFTKSKTASPFVKQSPVIVTFYEEEAPGYAAKAIQKGNLAVEAEQNAVLGRVTDIKLDKSVSWAQSPIGQVIPSSREGYNSLFVTIEGEGIFGETGVKVGTGDYYVGKSVTIKIGKAIFSGRIYNIEKKG